MPSSRTDPASLSGWGQPSSTFTQDQVMRSRMQCIGLRNTCVELEDDQWNCTLNPSLHHGPVGCVDVHNAP